MSALKEPWEIGLMRGSGRRLAEVEHRLRETVAVGMTTDELRARVRTDFTGSATCTHLNDVLRSLADLPVLAAALDSD